MEPFKFSPRWFPKLLGLKQDLGADHLRSTNGCRAQVHCTSSRQHSLTHSVPKDTSRETRNVVIRGLLSRCGLDAITHFNPLDRSQDATISNLKAPEPGRRLTGCYQNVAHRVRFGSAWLGALHAKLAHFEDVEHCYGTGTVVEDDQPKHVKIVWAENDAWTLLGQGQE